MGCGADEEVPGGEEGDVADGTYVGQVEGTDAYIAVVYGSRLDVNQSDEVNETKQVGGYVTDNGQVSIWNPPMSPLTRPPWSTVRVTRWAR